MSTPARKILVGVAWPYANGEKHIGQIAGAYLPPDIFARYQRMVGNDPLMVSGSTRPARSGAGACESTGKEASG